MASRGQSFFSRIFAGLIIALVLGSQSLIGAVTSAQLGRIILKDRYAGINLDYDVYYGGGPLANGRTGGYHPGVDFAASMGTPVYSPVSGSVTYTEPTYGQLAVKIDNSNDFFIFMHLSGRVLSVGDRVSQGTLIGYSGKTSPTAVGPHLHVEVRTGKSNGAFYFYTPSDTGVNKPPGSVVTDLTKQAPAISGLSASSDSQGNVTVTFSVTGSAGERVSQTDVWVCSGSSAVSGTYLNGSTYTLGAHRVVIPESQLRGKISNGSYYTVGVRAYDSTGQRSPDAFSGAFRYTAPLPVSPQISVTAQGAWINGDGSQSSATTFNGTNVGSSDYRQFTISNSGNGTLYLGSTVLSNTSDFSVYSYPSSSVGPGQSTSFVIRFSPSTAGSKTCDLSLYNNDARINPFRFRLAGTAYGVTSNSSAIDRFASSNASWLGNFTGITSPDSTWIYRKYSSGIWVANSRGTNQIWCLINGQWYNYGNW